MQRLFLFSALLFLFGCFQKENELSKARGFFPIKEYGKWGYINSNGQTIIKCQFDNAEIFYEGLAAVQIDSLYGFIDTTGKIVIEPKFTEVTHFSDGLCNVGIKKGNYNQNMFIKKNGEISFTTEYVLVGFFSCGKAAVEIDDEICFIDKTGKIAFNTHFPYGSGSMFHEGIARVWNGDESKCIDSSGMENDLLSKMVEDDFSEGLARAYVNDSVCFVDKNGNVKIRLKNQELTYFNFSDGLAQAVITGIEHKSGFIDKKGKLVIPIIYHRVFDFKEGLAAFYDDRTESFGFLNREGNITIKPQFDWVDYAGFSNGLCQVKQNHQWGYINQLGKFVWKEQPDITYRKIDLSKWKLDTLKLNEPYRFSKYAGGDNFPRKKVFPSLTDLILKIDTTDITAYEDRYFGLKLYLINASKDTVTIEAQDGRIKIVQQALNQKGEWQDIVIFHNSFCGNSYYDEQLSPNDFYIFPTPIFKGEFRTKLRFRFELSKKKTIYSNTYTGNINLSQFLLSKDQDQTDIAVWSSGG